MNKILSCRLRELKNKGKVQLGNPKSGRGRLRELFITKSLVILAKVWLYHVAPEERIGSLRRYLSLTFLLETFKRYEMLAKSAETRPVCS